jgi:biotin carboxylase
MTRNVFIVGCDDFNLEQIRSVRGAADCRFHPLCELREIKWERHPSLEEIVRGCLQELRDFPGSVDAIVGWWDFPVSTVLPILRRELGLPGPTLESLLRCEHKYWSRLEQRRVVGDHVPRFAAVDPFAQDAAEAIGLDFPFWLKPVKSASSYLGFLVRDRRELERALEAIRQGIRRLAEPFNWILGQAELPAEIAAVDGWHCIAEALISRGSQCTLEGYVHRGDVRIYGVVDSVRTGAHRSSFARYQYPSILPRRVHGRMIDITRRFMEHIGYDDSPFNIEFYWDRETDRLSLLEVNTRISKSHTPLFKLVDGEYHHAVMLDLALGRRPDFPHREGACRVAAKFMLRHHRDARVTRVPTDEEIGRLRERFPEVQVQIEVEEGMRLSELASQDSYSYEIAVIFLGADSQPELLRRYRACLDLLDFRLESP